MNAFTEENVVYLTLYKITREIYLSMLTLKCLLKNKSKKMSVSVAFIGVG